MDWLEEYAEKLRQYIRNASLLGAAAAYLLIAMLGSLACASLTVNITSLWIHVMTERAPTPVEAVRVLKTVRQICPYFFMLLFVILAGRLYVKNKIASALTEIGTAVRYMAAGDLSYEMAWRSQDELGMLVRNVEDLQETLKKDKENQWRMGEEQRKINAAFAHDLRTPLTVMKGYTEFLQKYVPEGKVTDQMLLEKLERIQAQEERLLSFSKTMTTLQKMEQWEVHCSRRKIAEIGGRIREAAEGMQRAEIRFTFSQPPGCAQEVLADLDLILEAAENILQNAFRYAREKVEIVMQYEKNRLILYVKDDGEGFSEKALREADTVYFCERKEGEEEEGHFGIGLSITKMLCEKHGGELKLFNSVEGGAVMAVSFFAGQ